MTLTCQKHLFSLDKDTIYLNGAYMSPMLKSVEQTGIEGMLQKRSPNNVATNSFFEGSDKLRSSFSQLINGQNPNDCAIIASVSYGIATVANNINLSKKDEILMVNEQFPSNYYSWDVLAKKTGATIKVVSASENEPRGKSWNENILNSITPQTKVVTMPHVHWADGTKFDLEAIREATNNVGAYLIIDGTQSVGALPFDIQKIQPDALICAGYKWLLGPYSIGMAYFGERLQGGTPIEENWINRLDSEDFAGLVNYESQYLPGSLRYEVGEHSNFILTPMLNTSIEQLNSWTPEAIQNYCKAISQPAIDKLSENGFIIEKESYRSSHLFGIRVGDKNVEQIKLKLEAENIYVSIRGNAIRVSPNVYNTEEDINALAECLLK
ncbi:MAG: aminotransferase class V-fold PLP-dependent enzyme [Cyclobacteriaceae bacterium]|nr:aminotransferase class V-fold PLP-dependent enzyme [Cyclobacteriaceae bacterium]